VFRLTSKQQRYVRGYGEKMLQALASELGKEFHDVLKHPVSLITECSGMEATKVME
jgi:hypothetical protein